MTDLDKMSLPRRKLLQHENLYLIGLISIRSKILNVGNFLQSKPFLYLRGPSINDVGPCFQFYDTPPFVVFHCLWHLISSALTKLYRGAQCWGDLSILGDFRLLGYKLSCCGSVWSRTLRPHEVDKVSAKNQFK